MWEKKYLVAKKSVSKKVIAAISYVILMIAFSIIYKRTGVFDDFESDSIPLVVFIFTFIPLMIVLVGARNYRTVGSMTFNANQIRVSTKRLNETFNLNDVDYITLHFKGILGESNKGFDVILAGSYSKDGSGNILEFFCKQKTYKINIVFETQEDFDALKSHFKEIEESSEIVPMIVYRS